MPLNLYRRHYRAAGKCSAGYPADFRNYETDELRRGWKKCHCPIYADGTLNGQFKRKNTKGTTWTSAKQVVGAWEATGTWDAKRIYVPSLEPSSPPVENGSVTVEFAADAYLANRRNRNIAPATLRKYVTFFKQFRAFTETEGLMCMGQVQPVHMDRFYGTWRDGIRAKAKKLSRLKTFLNFCVRRKWMAENPSFDLEAPVGAGVAAHRMPFTDTELVRIYDACDRMPVVEWKNHVGIGQWDGQDVQTMIMLLCWTGLRISDAATFDMSRVTPHPEGGANVFLRMHKTNGALFTWVDDWLYERLLTRQRRLGPKIFVCGTSTRLDTMTETWRRRINRVFEFAGSFECGRPTPHIFRHTFVRLLLQRGVPPREVAELIGDTEGMVLKHYARWVPERQERLTNILREKLATAPRGNLMVMSSAPQRAKR